jgi:hypothetical protein
VRILLERVKSNPEEVTQEYGKWHQLRDAVCAYKENGERRAWLRGLREEEIDLLYEAFCTGARQIFDDYVMRNVLGVEDEKEEKFPPAYIMAQGKRVQQAQMAQNIAQNLYNPHQNAIQPIAVPPGSWQNVANQSSNTSVVAQQSLVARLKQELGIK